MSAAIPLFSIYLFNVNKVNFPSPIHLSIWFLRFAVQWEMFFRLLFASLFLHDIAQPSLVKINWNILRNKTLPATDAEDFTYRSCQKVMNNTCITFFVYCKFQSRMLISFKTNAQKTYFFELSQFYKRRVIRCYGRLSLLKFYIKAKR